MIRRRQRAPLIHQYAQQLIPQLCTDVRSQSRTSRILFGKQVPQADRNYLL